MDATKTGSFIAEIRREQGLTQKQLAQRLLVSDKAVSRWETGHGMPDINNLEALSDALGVSVAELLRGERIVEPVEPAEAEELTLGSLELVRRLWRKRTVGNIVAGFLASIVVLALLVVHLTAPIYLPYRSGLVQVEKTADGTLIALLDNEAQGCETDLSTDPDTGDVTVFISCYQTRWHQLTGTSTFGPHIGTFSGNVVSIGHEDTVDHAYYYPGTSDDVLLYTNNKPLGWAGVMTLPRLVYNGWLMLGIAASVIGLVAWVLLRKRWYAERVLLLALLPVCFTASLVAVLWGHFGEVYNAAFYLSGICLVAIALYGLASLIISRRKPKLD